MSQNGIRDILKTNQVIPVVTFHNTAEVNKSIDKLAHLGINCMEITLRTSFALEAIAYAKKTMVPHFKLVLEPLQHKSTSSK